MIKIWHVLIHKFLGKYCELKNVTITSEVGIRKTRAISERVRGENCQRRSNSCHNGSKVICALETVNICLTHYMYTRSVVLRISSRTNEFGDYKKYFNMKAVELLQNDLLTFISKDNIDYSAAWNATASILEERKSLNSLQLPQ